MDEEETAITASTQLHRRTAEMTVGRMGFESCDTHVVCEWLTSLVEPLQDIVRPVRQ